MDEYTDIEINAENLHRFYGEYFAYYESLDEASKQRFLDRCSKFIVKKNIRGAGGFEADNKVRAIVAASAVQLTLGLDEWMLGHFDTILIYPQEFAFKPTGQLSQGQTVVGGHIHLSWKNFLSGYLRADDNINLGLHEFTHALHFTPARGHDQDYFIEHYFHRWLAAAYEAYSDLKNNRKSIFRKYGGTNLNEFMSVCVEHFFESPNQIRAAYPFLYFSTAILLNQVNVDGRTYLNIRKLMFEAKNELSLPMTPLRLKTRFARSSSGVVVCVTAVPLLLTLITTGLTAGTWALAAIGILFYLRYDYNFVSVSLQDKMMVLSRGAWMFRRRRSASVPVSQIVSLRAYESASSCEIELLYYDSHSGYFYQESIGGPDIAPATLLRECWQNRIAVFRRRL